MKRFFLVLFILLIAGFLRSIYCYNMPVSGDESVSLLQAAGKALQYDSSAPLRPITRVEELQSLMAYSPKYGAEDVLDSMEKAGMHPPLYYVLLHYILRFFGNEIIPIRLPSIIFSTLSVFMIYMLCKRLFGRTEALVAATLLAISAYGVHFAHMIRPYPLMMFMSLTSTWLMIRMYQDNAIRFSSPTLWGYILTTAIGFYGIYHYLFTVIFQAIFLILVTWKNKKQLLMVFSIFFITAAFYLPWIPRFFTQFGVVKSGAFYFNETSNPIATLRYLFEFNLTRALPGDYAWYKIIPLAFLLGFAVLGVQSCFSTATGRYFTAALIGYLIISYAADLLMHAKTMNVPKLLFFMAPLLVVYVSAGVVILLKRSLRFGMPLFIIVCVSICVNTALTVNNSRADDDPYDLPQYRDIINSIATADTLNLVLLNQTNVRYTMSLAHAIDTGEVQMLAHRDSLEFIQKEGDLLKKYDRVFVASPRVHKTLSAEDVADIQECMQKNNFKLSQPAAAKDLLVKGSLLVFEKKVASITP